MTPPTLNTLKNTIHLLCLLAFSVLCSIFVRVSFLQNQGRNLLYIIITFGTNVSFDDTVFYNGIFVYDLGQSDQLLKDSHGICIVGQSEVIFHENTTWRVNVAVISFIFH